MNILLLCSSRFALSPMRDLVHAKQLAAVAIPSFNRELVEEVQQLLTPMGIPVITTDKKNNEAELLKAIKKYKIDMGFMMTYSYKIPASVFNLPPKGFFNFHPGPLPEYRGADPVFQQVKNREKLAGVTVHKVDDGFDTGPVVIKEMTRLEPTDTYGILSNKLSELSAKLCGLLVRMAGFDFAIPAKPQDESKARFFPRQSAKELSIDWGTMTAAEIVALINASNPWNKGAFTSFNHRIIRLLAAAPEPGDAGDATPGRIISMDDNDLTVAVINNELLRISYLYIEEGFLKAGMLSNIGLVAGRNFDRVVTP